MNILCVLLLVVPTIAMIIYSVKEVYPLLQKEKSNNLSDLIKSGAIKKHILEVETEAYSDEEELQRYKNFIDNSPIYKYIISLDADIGGVD